MLGFKFLDRNDSFYSVIQRLLYLWFSAWRIKWCQKLL